MIIDKLQNASQYFAINSRFQKAFEFLADKNLTCIIHKPNKLSTTLNF